MRLQLLCVSLGDSLYELFCLMRVCRFSVSCCVLLFLPLSDGSFSSEPGDYLDGWPARLRLNAKESRRYIDESSEFHQRVNRFYANARQHVRLNLGDDFAEYLTNADFHARIDALVEDPLEQIWSDVEYLNLAGSDVHDISALAGLRNLRSLYLLDTSVQTITSLQRLTYLQILDLSGTNVQDLTALAGLKYLEELYLIDTPVQDLHPLRGLTRLQELYLVGSRVRDVRDSLPYLI